jgi:hypothetical protein
VNYRFQRLFREIHATEFDLLFVSMVECVAVVFQFFPCNFSIFNGLNCFRFSLNYIETGLWLLFLLMIPLIYGRKRLFSLINDLPTVFEVVTERKPIKDKPTVDSGSKSRGSTKVSVILLCKSELD